MGDANLQVHLLSAAYTDRHQSSQLSGLVLKMCRAVSRSVDPDLVADLSALLYVMCQLVSQGPYSRTIGEEMAGVTPALPHSMLRRVLYGLLMTLVPILRRFPSVSRLIPVATLPTTILTVLATLHTALVYHRGRFLSLSDRAVSRTRVVCSGEISRDAVLGIVMLRILAVFSYMRALRIVVGAAAKGAVSIKRKFLPRLSLDPRTDTPVSPSTSPLTPPIVPAREPFAAVLAAACTPSTDDVRVADGPPIAPTAAPPEAALPVPTCAICLGTIPFGQAAAPPCGHVACWGCLADSLAGDGRCPSCRGGASIRTMVRVWV